ncbi:probable aquaporin TIP4-3 [Zingiber officinale]|uniref:Uncharacterized protein n=1 Tax=Zingiber officinale TaxID=94328 RepID=A0A8J5I9P1_ZINOF|nr:probable aquaporin TIP4-3 [Zingiber officinale]KAG6531121.1 hypothetical protein ZIOFF_004892 [Zingiber officinale]
MAKIALGSWKEAADPEFPRSVFTELLLTFVFVFTGVSAAVSAEEMGGGQGTITGLTAAAATNAMLVAVIVAVGMDASAGHLNPAVTIGFAAGGYVTVIRCALYIVAQLLGSAAACFLLMYISGGQDLPMHALGSGMRPLQGLVMELLLTFSMVFTIYAVVVEPKKGVVSSVAPLLVGLIVGANTLAGGYFSGASMNPARSFGPALARWNWTDHWIYWAGPLVGSALAGFVYDRLYVTRSSDDGAFLLPVDREEAFS